MHPALAALPKPDSIAWLLDLDGTLIDIAPAPDQVVVAPGLIETLHRLRARSGNALAVVTGRPIAQVDALLGEAPYAVAGEHGTAIRHSPGGAVEQMALPMPPPGWIDAAHALVATHPGTLFEPKAHGFVLHYRAAPSAGAILRRALADLLAGQDEFSMLAAKMAWEIRPAGADKGVAVTALMRRRPFADRVPVFVGDDVTDEDGMRAAVALGGAGLMLPDIFGTPAEFRRWLAMQANPTQSWMQNV